MRYSGSRTLPLKGSAKALSVGRSVPRPVSGGSGRGPTELRATRQPRQGLMTDGAVDQLSLSNAVARPRMRVAKAAQNPIVFQVWSMILASILAVCDAIAASRRTSMSV